MGKKGKIGKDRKDKFYKLAKETGFRSRAAFKLIQLNRKFGFLQESQVCIDLCAAPGGWMQVAKQNMPVSSIVVGVDLFPIRAIPGCISLVEDITTEKCKASLTKELQSWKADVVLHDGAPNVGKNWLFDAYQQICLTLQSVKLATHFLRKGGWFVTKVFRSKDYNALLWVLKQLFRKVHATKPSASRKESAEIFVVCQGYIAPDKIDPKFLDVKYVFEELDLESSKPVSILNADKKKRIKAEGYTEEDFSTRHELLASEFIQNANGLNALQGVAEIVIDTEEIKSHPKTTSEIHELCKDIKVLGRKDLRVLLNWWKQLRATMFPKSEVKEEEIDTEEKEPLTEEQVEDMEFEELEKHIADIELEQNKDDKRKKKKVQKARSKLNQQLNLKMVIKGDSGPTEEDIEVFRLSQISNQNQLDALQDQAPDMVLDEADNSNNEFKPKYVSYAKDGEYLNRHGQFKDSDEDSTTMDESSEDEEEDFNTSKGLGFSDEEEDSDLDTTHLKEKKKAMKNSKKEKNPLITDLDTRDKDAKRQHRVQLWFENDKLKDIENEVDEDIDLNKLSADYKQRGVKVLGEDRDESEVYLGKKARRRQRHKDEMNASSSSDSSDSELEDEIPAKTNGTAAGGPNPPKKKYKLDEEELALGTLMVKSKKLKRDLVDAAWNRYTFNDENLPEWFVQDEAMNMRREAPVPKELVSEYKARMEEVNVRSIKKVMEAKSRKKKRSMKRLAKAKRKAESILENADASNQEKMRQLKKLYKKASDEKKEITYVVAKKHQTGKRARRPPGVKGQFRVVDRRLKKDKRAVKAKNKRKK